MSTTAADSVAPTDPPGPKPGPGPLDYVYKAIKPLASLQLTVGLFAVGIALIFLGTVAQINYGIWTVVDKYFWSWVVWVPFDIFHQFGEVFFDLSKDERWGGTFPFPGGKLVGGAMLVNLLAAHLTRFRLTWKRSGVLLIHAGLILLFVGEFVTREYAVEQQMTINEGETVNFAVDTRNYEIAFTRTTDAGRRDTVVPQDKLVAGARVAHEELPADVEVVKFMKNADFLDPGPKVENPATAGAGLRIVAVEKPEESGVATEQRGDIPAAYVKLTEKGTGREVGTFLVTPLLTIQGVTDAVPGTDGAVKMAMRNKRLYKPFSIHLIEFRHDKYVGTELPKNFSSKVVVIDPELGTQREVVISMNDPLRYRGETFYQASFDKRTEKTTTLQVVRNPGWTIPYISCIVVTLGMVVHFGIYLTQFLVRRAAA